VLAPQVEGGIDQQVVPDLTGGAKIDHFGVAQKPGPLVVEGGDAVFKPPDLEGDGEALALGTHRGAGGWRGQYSSHSLGDGGRGIFVNSFTRGRPRGVDVDGTHSSFPDSEGK
jgi:hypothetical protein